MVRFAPSSLIFSPSQRALALVVGWTSVLSFVVLAFQVGPINDAIAGVLRVDYVALAVLVVLTVARIAK